MNGVHVKTGYIVMKSWDNIKNTQSNYGQVHGSLYKWLFGVEPQGNCDDIEAIGFAKHRGVWKFHSGCLNDRFAKYDAPQDVQNKIKTAVQGYWKSGQQNFYL